MGSENQVPKAALYYSQNSVWSAVALLALKEKGYGVDEVDLKKVDLATGENFSPTFLRLNPKATVPTLVVPLDKTLSEEVESRYRAITDSTPIAEFLDKSRSVQSRTHTTSDAPAPILTPATMAFSTTAKDIIELLHSKAADPDNLWYMNMRDQKTLSVLSKEVLPLLLGQEKALSHYLSEARQDKIVVSEKTKRFWLGKKQEVQELLDVFLVAEKSEEELNGEEQSKRRVFMTTGERAWERELKGVVGELEKTVIGPYALGEQYSIADLHLAPWLARVAKLVGCTAEDDGVMFVSKLASRVGGELLSQERGRDEESKLGVYWDSVRGRKSWAEVYGAGLCRARDVG